MINKWKGVKPLKIASSLQQIENTWNIELPQSFKQIVYKSNAGVPEPNAFDTDQSKGKQFAELLNCNLEDEDNILQEYELISDKLPSLVFPFAADAGGNYVCFDYRQKKSEPSVVFWNHEERFDIEDGELVNKDVDEESDLHVIEYVAENFEAFLNKLYAYGFSFDDDDIENAVVF